jgi:hypothetical protein
MRAHGSGRVTSFVTERDGVRWHKILHLTGCKILHLTGYDVSDAVHTTLALDISMSNCSLVKKNFTLCMPFTIWLGKSTIVNMNFVAEMLEVV